METSFQLEEWLVDPLHGQIVGPAGPIRLEPRVMRVLVCLAERSGEIVSREQLIEQVWEGTVVTDEVLTQSVSELRKALGEEPKEPRFIQTIPKQGYRLIAAAVPTHEAGVERIVQEPVEPKGPIRRALGFSTMSALKKVKPVGGPTETVRDSGFFFPFRRTACWRFAAARARSGSSSGSIEGDESWVGFRSPPPVSG